MSAEDSPKISPKISMIAAMSRNRAIGRGNDLPWNVPEDMQHFRSTTKGHPILMGRKTFESMPGPLPARLNVVITRNAEYTKVLEARGFKGVEVVPSIEAGLELIRKLKPEAKLIFIGGGAEIYRQALPLADEIILTTIDTDVSDGDAFFPEFPIGNDAGKFKVVRSQKSASTNPSQLYEWYERQ